MSLFSRRKDTGTAAATRKKGAAQRLEVFFEGDTSNKGLAFGVAWRSIATSGGRDDAVKQARTSGASHFIFRNQQAGWGVMPGDVDSAARIYPAAVVAARLLTGAAVCAVKLADGEYWVAALLNGQPTSVDELYRDVDDAAALSRVRELLEEFSGAAPVVHTNIRDHGLDEVKPFAGDDLFRAPMGEGDLLQPLPKPGMAIPKPVLALAAVMVVVLLGKQGWQRYEEWKRARAATAAAAVEVDPEQAWADAIAAWERGISAPNGRGLTAVRASLEHLAVDWNGWKLEKATCNAAAPVLVGAGATRTWSCTAMYTRQGAGMVNREMVKQNLPAGWAVSFTPLNGMNLSWVVAEPVQLLKLVALHKPDYFNVEVASRLQRLLPALASEASFSFAAVTIPAPKKSDGSALPPDPRADGISQAVLGIRAPLRSIDALINADVEADWRSISVAYQQGLNGGIKSSALIAEVKGDMYAKR